MYVSRLPAAVVAAAGGALEIVLDAVREVAVVAVIEIEVGPAGSRKRGPGHRVRRRRREDVKGGARCSRNCAATGQQSVAGPGLADAEPAEGHHAIDRASR